MRISSRLSSANRGRSLETTIIHSQLGIVRLDQIPSGCKRIGRGQVIDVPSPVDCIGEVCDTGRAIHLDAKQCAEQYRFPVGDKSTLKPHQREWLIRHGMSKAIAGLVIEGTHESVRRFFWMSWRALLKTHEASITWDDERLIDIGDTFHLVDFKKIIAISPLEVRP